MLVFRSLALGLLGACFLLLAFRPTYEVKISQPPAPATASAPPMATIIDVAPGLPAAQIAALVHLAAGEHVTAVDDQPVAGDLDAGAVIAQRAPGSNEFVDLTVGGAAGPRRVLVLLH